MLVFLDTNVVLDFLLEREPWFGDSAAFWQAVEEGSITGCISASSVTDIYYIARRLVSPLTAHEAVRHCLDAFTIVSVGRDVLERASQMLGIDFEDNVQIVCAQAAHADAIVTRDGKGFRRAALPVLTPAEAVARLS